MLLIKIKIKQQKIGGSSFILLPSLFKQFLEADIEDTIIMEDVVINGVKKIIISKEINDKNKTMKESSEHVI